MIGKDLGTLKLGMVQLRGNTLNTDLKKLSRVNFLLRRLRDCVTVNMLITNRNNKFT